LSTHKRKGENGKKNKKGKRLKKRGKIRGGGQEKDEGKKGGKMMECLGVGGEWTGGSHYMVIKNLFGCHAIMATETLLVAIKLLR